MARRPRPSLADYAVIGISPALIMFLIGSLVFFLITMFYQGQFDVRLSFIMAMFIMAAVSIARISIEQGREYASLFALPLAGVTLFAMFRFVEFSGALARLSSVLNIGLIAMIWFCADKLTWDCTVIDENEDLSGKGLLQTAGLDDGQPGAEVDAEAASDDPSETPPPVATGLWQKFVEHRRRPHAPGIWVIYFSLAALPIFGFGQLFLRDDPSRRYAFKLLVVYVGSALGLLLTTSFLGLRRYLRQRRLEMPVEMAGTWLGVGAAMIVALLLVCMLMPRRNAEYSVSDLAFLNSPIELPVSDWGIGNDGQQQEDAERKVKQNEPQDKTPAQVEGQQGEGGQSESQQSQGGNKTKQAQQQTEGKNQSGGKDSGDKAGSKSAGNKSARQTQQGQGKNDKGSQRSTSPSEQQKSNNQEQGKNNGDQQGSKQGSKQGEQNQSKQQRDAERQQNQQKQNQQNKNQQPKSQSELPKSKQQEQSASKQSKSEQARNQQAKSQQRKTSPPQNQPNAPKPFNLSPSLGGILKALYWLIAIAVIGYLVWKNWEQVRRAVLNFIQSMQDLWARLFGGRSGEVAEAVSETTASTPTSPLFADYSDPFVSGRANQTPIDELIRYTFEAFEAWGRENGRGRLAEQTPIEFARKAIRGHRGLSKEAIRVAELYNWTAFGKTAVPDANREYLRRFWQELSASVVA